MASELTALNTSDHWIDCGDVDFAYVTAQAPAPSTPPPQHSITSAASPPSSSPAPSFTDTPSSLHAHTPDPTLMLRTISTAVASVITQEGLRPLIIGGDHSVSFPAVAGVLAPEDAPQKIDILHFDAHPDLYDELDGNRYSHACPFARIMENLPVERLLQIGIRTCNQHQLSQATKFRIEMVPMHQVHSKLFSHADGDGDSKRTNGLLHFENPLYISVDLDVLDPAYMPGVSHYEPGGLTTRELINLLQRVSAPAGVVGADIVELNVNPIRDRGGMGKYVAGKVFKELVALMMNETTTRM
jgi:arginase family enzyme